MSEYGDGHYLFKLDFELADQIRQDLKSRSSCIKIQDWILEAIYLRLRDTHEN